ncbi:MAG TPA: hypothetical protein DCS93_36740 [Microscillaceae bacterium]|nr:hypothetical protein [Microscillaceae bacterium]
MNQASIHQELNTPIIFLAFANPDQDLNLSREQQALEKLLKPLERAGFFQLIVKANISVEEVFHYFTEHHTRDRIAIFHYAGHALYQEIFFQTETADSEPLHQFLARQASLQLVFLNACTTQGQAQYLKQQGFPHVIGTSTFIGDQMAIDFAEEFYRNLTALFSIKESFENTKNLMESKGASRGGDTYTRHSKKLYPTAKKVIIPWKLHTNDETLAASLTLATAVQDPFFGLPTLSMHQFKLPRPPFVSLRHYSRDYAAVFFGRGSVIRELYKKLTSTLYNAPFILLYGQSGAGKSSMLDAGLCPRLEAGYEVLYLRRDHRLGLLGTLGCEFTGQKKGWTPKALLHQWNITQAKAQKPLVVILDQLEEVFTKPFDPTPDAEVITPNQELEQLFEVLQCLFEQPDFSGKVILSFRKEYLAEIEGALKHKGITSYQKQFLEVLQKEEIKEIVTGLANNPRTRLEYNLTVEPSLEETIAAELKNSHQTAVAPVLQIILSRMWQIAEEIHPPHFDHTVYQQAHTNGLGQFLAQQMEMLVPEFENEIKTGLVLDLLAHHTTDLGTAQMHVYEDVMKDYAHQSIRVRALLSKIEELRLLNVVLNQTSGLAHDTLAPIVREAFKNSDKDGQRAVRILENKVIDFQQDQTSLLDKVDLKTVLAGKAGMRNWNEDERTLVKASQRFWQRRRHFQKGMVGVFVGLVLGIIGFGIYTIKLHRENQNTQKRLTQKQKEVSDRTQALRQEREKNKKVIQQLEKSRKEALAKGDLAKAQKLAAEIANLKNKAQNLAAIANRNLRANPTFALQKSLEAYQLSQDFTIANALASSFYEWLQQPDTYQQFTEYYPLLLNGWSRAKLPTTNTWELQPHQGQTMVMHRQLGQPHPKLPKIDLAYEAGKVTLSNRLQYLAHYAEASPFITDLRSQKEAPLSQQPLNIATVDFSMNDQRLVALSAHQRRVYWAEVRQLFGKKPAFLKLLEDFPFEITAIKWLNNTELLLASGKNLYIYNVFTKNRKRLLHSGFGQQNSSIQQIVVSPQGNYLLLANAINQQIQVWDRQGHLIIEQSPEYLKKHQFQLKGITFSEDEQALYFPTYVPKNKVAVVLLPPGIYQGLHRSKIFEKLLNNQ